MDSRTHWRIKNINCNSWPKWTLLLSLSVKCPVVGTPLKLLTSKYIIKHICSICMWTSQTQQWGSCHASSQSVDMVWEGPSSKGEEESSETKTSIHQCCIGGRMDGTEPCSVSLLLGGRTVAVAKASIKAVKKLSSQPAIHFSASKW